MRRAGTVLAAIVVVAGLLVALAPVVSVWRLSGQVLDELPPVPARDVEDDQHRLAILDPEFELARRIYEGRDVTEVESMLLRDGFDYTGTGTGTGRALSKDCCGGYDAVWVQLADTGSGSTVATLSVADSDVQLSWSLLLILGLALMLGGGFGVLRSSRPTRSDQPHGTERSTDHLSRLR